MEDMKFNIKTILLYLQRSLAVAVILVSSVTIGINIFNKIIKSTEVVSSSSVGTIEVSETDGTDPTRVLNSIKTDQSELAFVEFEKIRFNMPLAVAFYFDTYFGFEKTYQVFPRSTDEFASKEKKLYDTAEFLLKDNYLLADFLSSAKKKKPDVLAAAGIIPFKVMAKLYESEMSKNHIDNSNLQSLVDAYEICIIVNQHEKNLSLNDAVVLSMGASHSFAKINSKRTKKNTRLLECRLLQANVARYMEEYKNFIGPEGELHDIYIYMEEISKAADEFKLKPDGIILPWGSQKHDPHYDYSQIPGLRTN